MLLSTRICTFSPVNKPRPGRYSCIGKNYAWMELRTVTALLVHKYDVCLAPGEDGSDLLNNSLDAFTLFTKDLKLVFSKRAEASASASV